MFEVFEPAEKKLELRLRAGSPSLRCLSSAFWLELVGRARAEIVAARETERTSSFLLSESSLFVFDERLVMITCGRSTLIESARYLLDALGVESIEALSFQRREEETSAVQWSSFEADAEGLARALPEGRVVTLGSQLGARLRRFDYEAAQARPPAHSSLELYMHEVLEPEADLSDLLAGFERDEHRFQPEGYSLNAVTPEGHRAVHVSPTSNGVYAGLDASDRDGAAVERLLDRALSRFRPRRFEVVLRRPGQRPSFLERTVQARVSYL